jgi:hypothetical protein
MAGIVEAAVRLAASCHQRCRTDEDSPKWKKSARSVCLCVCVCVCVCLSVVREHCGKHATLGRLADRCLPHPSLESSRFSDVRSIPRNKLTCVTVTRPLQNICVHISILLINSSLLTHCLLSQIWPRASLLINSAVYKQLAHSLLRSVSV